MILPGVTYIGAFAFSEYPDIDVVIPDTVTSIGAGAFCYSNLTDITIPESVTSIGVGAFYHCENLSDVSIKQAYPNLWRAFYDTPWWNDNYIAEGTLGDDQVWLLDKKGTLTVNETSDWSKTDYDYYDYVDYEDENSNGMKIDTCLMPDAPFVKVVVSKKVEK